MDVSKEVASAVSGGAIPGFSGSVVEVLLCTTGGVASVAAVALVGLLLCPVMAK